MTGRSRRRRWGEWTLAFAAGCIVTLGTIIVSSGTNPFPVPVMSPSASVSPVPLPDDAWASTTSTALPVNVTPPGTTLALGDQAQIDIAVTQGKRALVSVTADAPTLAPAADQAALTRAVPQLEGMSVFYYRVRVTKIAGTGMAGVELAPLFEAVTNNGSVVQRLTIRDWRACQGGALPAQIDDASGEVQLCFAAAAPRDGLVPTGVRFSQSGGPYDAAQGTALTWSGN